MEYQKHYGNNEFTIDQGEVKFKNGFSSSWVKYILDFLFYKSHKDTKFHEDKLLFLRFDILSMKINIPYLGLIGVHLYFKVYALLEQFTTWLVGEDFYNRIG